MAQPRLLPLVLAALIAFPATAHAITWTRNYEPAVEISDDSKVAFLLVSGDDIGKSGRMSVTRGLRSYLDRHTTWTGLEIAKVEQYTLDVPLEDIQEMKNVPEDADVLILGYVTTEYGDSSTSRSAPSPDSGWDYGSATGGRMPKIKPGTYSSITVSTYRSSLEASLTLRVIVVATGEEVSVKGPSAGIEKTKEGYRWSADDLVQKIVPELVDPAGAMLVANDNEVTYEWAPKNDRSALTQLGIDAAEAGDYLAAAEFFRQSIAEDPARVASEYCNLVIASDLAGDYEEARELARDGLHFAPGCIQLQEHLQDLQTVFVRMTPPEPSLGEPRENS